jgi:tryptophanyl-tRNA synthetase
LTKKTTNEVEKEFADSNYGTFKKAVADVVVEVLTKIQMKYNEIISSSLIDDILDRGREVTTEIARKKYEEVRQKVGLGRI